MRGFPLRFVGYLLAVALVIEAAALAIGVWGARWVLREDGLVEWGEVVLLGLAGFLALACARRAPETRGLYALAAVSLWLIVFREFDNSFAYSLLSTPTKVGLLLGTLGTTVILGRRNLVSGALALLARPHGMLLVLGVIMVFAWAQLLGQPAIWRSVYPLDYGPGRRVVEELLELGGHLLILIGLIEEYLWLRRRPAAA